MMVLPYLLVLNGMLMAVLLYIILSRHSSFVSFHIGIPFFVLFVVTFAMGYWIYDFSFAKEVHAGKKEILKVAFFNKLYENKNYAEIRKGIQSTNPDIIGLSEVTKEDLEHVAFQEAYQYIYTKPYRDYFLVVLSKYPLTIEQIPDAPHAFAAKGSISGEKYAFIVAHPFAALNPQTLLGRNEELEALSQYVGSLRDTNLVLLGDMNTSPWSASYVKFTSNIHGLKNAAKGEGLSATWKFGPLITQIDHILVSEALHVQSYSTIPVHGSDHNMLLATLSEI